MRDIKELIKRLIEISEVELPGGWRGWVAVRAAGRDRFSKSDWIAILGEPEKLLDGAQQTLKSDGPNVVVVKYLTVAGMGVKVVMKRHRRGKGIREFFRLMAAPRALRNFIAAVKTSQYGLPVAEPLAAVYHRKFLFCDQSIYISEYVEGPNLYKFLKNIQAGPGERMRIIKLLSEKIAEIFAGLHENNLWHRDAKATNFIVSGYGPDNYKIVLTDMDGIKQNSSNNRERQMRGLWQLAASVMGLKTITNADYLRVFNAYCDKMNVPAGECRDMLHQIIDEAQAKHQRNLRRTEP